MPQDEVLKKLLLKLLHITGFICICFKIKKPSKILEGLINSLYLFDNNLPLSTISVEITEIVIVHCCHVFLVFDGTNVIQFFNLQKIFLKFNLNTS